MEDHDIDEKIVDGEGRSGRVTGWIKSLSVLLVIVVLSVGIVYLLSERNARRYFLVVEGGDLLVQRVIFFPVGERRFDPEDPNFAAAYHPIPVPSGAEVESRQIFDERTELDRVLVDKLLVWSKARLDPEQPDRLEQGIYYLRRAEGIPTTTSAQRGEMEVLRGEVAYHEGRRFIESALRNLDTARERLIQARDSPAGWGRESRLLLDAIRTPEAALRRALREGAGVDPEIDSDEPEDDGRNDGGAPSVEQRSSEVDLSSNREDVESPIQADDTSSLEKSGDDREADLRKARRPMGTKLDILPEKAPLQEPIPAFKQPLPSRKLPVPSELPDVDAAMDSTLDEG